MLSKLKFVARSLSDQSPHGAGGSGSGSLGTFPPGVARVVTPVETIRFWQAIRNACSCVGEFNAGWQFVWTAWTSGQVVAGQVPPLVVRLSDQVSISHQI